jgi:hypothetical protein
MFSERKAPCKSFKLDENLEQFRLEIGLTLLLLQFDAANGFAELDQKPKVFLLNTCAGDTDKRRKTFEFAFDDNCWGLQGTTRNVHHHGQFKKHH